MRFFEFLFNELEDIFNLEYYISPVFGFLVLFVPLLALISIFRKWFDK